MPHSCVGELSAFFLFCLFHELKLLLFLSRTYILPVTFFDRRYALLSSPHEGCNPTTFDNAGKEKVTIIFAYVILCCLFLGKM